jgi:hypothetical protein
MRVEKTEQKLVDVVVSSYRVCDKCDERIKLRGFEDFSCEIELREGRSYPECSNGVTRKIELCQSCSKDLFKLLEKNDYNSVDEKWDH